MLPQTRARAADATGFTLIELLVVVLIIGILAAIAIPSFLNQSAKAEDAQAKAVARTAQTAEETAFTDSELYVSQAAGAGAGGALSTLERTLTGPSAACVGSPPYAVSPCGLTAAATGSPASGYSISVTSRTGIVFTLARSATGDVSRTCNVAGARGAVGGCHGVVQGRGTW